MKNLSFILILLFCIACNSNTATDSSTAASTAAIDTNIQTDGVVDVAGFAKLLEAEHLLVDVRTPEEFAEGYIAAATNINFYDDDFADRATKLDKSKPVLVYCKKGGRSAKAYKILKGAGFEKVYDLDGGFTAWKSAGQPVSK